MTRADAVALRALATKNGLVGGPFGSSLIGTDYTPAGVPVIRGTNLGHGRFLGGDYAHVSSGKANGELARNQARPGDLVFTQRGTLGQVAMVPDDGPDTYVVSQSQMRLRVDPAKADPRFVYYACTTNDFMRQIGDHAIATGVPHINLGILGTLRIPDVPRAEQRAIAEVLGALDDKIAANTHLAALSDELARTAARRGLSKSIDTVRLGDLVTVTKGVSYRSADLVPSDTALVTLKSFSRDGSYAARGLKPYAGDFRAEQVVATGDLAVAQTDLTQAAEVVGRVVSVPPAEEFKTLVASLDLAIVRPKPGVPRGFLLGLLWQDDFRFHCRDHTSGTTVLHLAIGAIESYFAPRLPAEVMESIAAEVEPLASVAPRIHAESRALAATRDALLPALMSGALRVRDAERLAEHLT